MYTRESSLPLLLDLLHGTRRGCATEFATEGAECVNGITVIRGHDAPDRQFLKNAEENFWTKN